MQAAQLLRPRDSDAIRAELRRIYARCEVPVLFGGEVFEDTVLLTEVLGGRTGGLRGLAVHRSCGLGGATLVTKRPLAVSDYRHASNITHDYDPAVLAEGLRSVIAVPILVDRQPRAVLYCARREAAPVGNGVANLMLASAATLAHELAIRDEVDHRVRLRGVHLSVSSSNPSSAEDIRAVHAELRCMAADASIASPLRSRLRTMADKLSNFGDSTATVATLTAREVDVLAQIALGCSNREAAKRLSLQPETVKSYLRSAAAKLGTRNRYEAVSVARLAGLLP